MNWTYRPDGTGLYGVYWNGIRTLTTGPYDSATGVLVDQLNATGAVPQETMATLTPNSED